jgi:hypothetical protein
MRTAVEWLVEEINKLTGLTILMDEPCVEQAKAIEKDQLGALYLTLLLNTPDITKFDFEEWYTKNTENESR